MDLTRFLTDRIAEDEAAAMRHRVEAGRTGWGDYINRVLMECEAKRRIIKEHGSGFDPCDAHDADYHSVPCDTLLYLAAVYADHAGYRAEWHLDA
jgi:hypothetical protein